MIIFDLKKGSDQVFNILLNFLFFSQKSLKNRPGWTFFFTNDFFAMFLQVINFFYQKKTQAFEPNHAPGPAFVMLRLSSQRIIPQSLSPGADLCVLSGKNWRGAMPDEWFKIYTR